MRYEIRWWSARLCCHRCWRCCLRRCTVAVTSPCSLLLISSNLLASLRDGSLRMMKYLLRCVGNAILECSRGLAQRSSRLRRRRQVLVDTPCEASSQGPQPALVPASGIHSQPAMCMSCATVAFCRSRDSTMWSYSRNMGVSMGVGAGPRSGN